MGLVCEIEFVPVYKDQPLFDDVHREMREYGLTIYDLRTHRTYRPFNGRCFSWYRDKKGFARHSFDLNGRLVAGDALHIRDFEDRPPENLAADSHQPRRDFLTSDLSEGIEDGRLGDERMTVLSAFKVCDRAMTAVDAEAPLASDLMLR